ncbi:MAG: metal-sulfur cluster assembly factor [Limisphaerales bacterium]
MNPPVTEELVLAALRQVIDPELGCNIVDLGLIYDLQIVGDTVRVKMTLTTPGCPMSESIAWGVKTALLNLEPVMDAEVELVWEPRWHPDMASEAGRAALGLRPA